MELKAELKYTKSHEWIAKDGDVATIGLTDYAQSELGDLVFVNLPEEGDEVTVLVKSIDRENKRVALSIKATLEDPWKVEASQFHIGDILDVEVVRLLAFGAIVKLSDKVEGLVHISEIAPERIEAPSDVLEVGQVVKAEIIKMDLDSKKIGLSISKVKRDAEKNEFRSYMGSKKSHLSQNLSEQLESLEK